jgi:hypothetical protein
MHYHAIEIPGSGRACNPDEALAVREAKENYVA